MSAVHAVQLGIRTRLIARPQLVALVPADNILDRNARPAPDPSIILGEDQAVDVERMARNVVRVYSTLHLWKRETGLAGVKKIGWQVRLALHVGRLALDLPFECADCFVTSERYLRDADGETAHGVLTIETLVSEV